MTRSIVGKVRELWRYPVKSMGGEMLEVCDLHTEGLHGDRRWAVRDEQEGQISGGKRIPRLMMCTASLRGNFENGDFPHVSITVPGGAQLGTDHANVNAELSRYMDRDVTLWPLQDLRETDHYRLAQSISTQEVRRQLGIEYDEADPDFSEMPLGLLYKLSKYVTLPGTYFDAYPLHILTTASLETLQKHYPAGSFDSRRFRPNILIETVDHITGLAEFSWCGGLLHIGSAVIKCEVRTIRCAMPSYAQPDLERDADVSRTVRDVADRHLGIYATVVQPGRVRVGDEVAFMRPRFMKFGSVSRTIKKKMKKGVLSVWSQLID